jgi:3-hydroxyisobutyrate dehydrogenase
MSSAIRVFRRTAFTASTSSRASIGFIGLGNMGAPMAQNLLKRHHQVTVFDVNPLVVKQLVSAHGAKSAPSPAALAGSGVDVVVTMLPSSPHARAVYTGENGVLSTIKSGALLVDASTIDPTVSRELALAAAQKGAAFIDAPVSGGVGGATNGTLTFMVGGAREAFDKAKPILECMGKNVVYCGGPGNGQVVKICNNLVLGISMIGVSEAMNLGIKLGMDPKTLAGIFNTSSARCWSSDTYNPVPGVIDGVPSSRNYDGGFGSASWPRISVSLSPPRTTSRRLCRSVALRFRSTISSPRTVSPTKIFPSPISFSPLLRTTTQTRTTTMIKSDSTALLLVQ